MKNQELQHLLEIHNGYKIILDQATKMRVARDLVIVDMITSGRATRYEVAKFLEIAESTVGRIVKVHSSKTRPT
jgi:hypothetical protein